MNFLIAVSGRVLRGTLPWLLAFAAAPALAAPPSAEDYARRPFISDVAVSPSGTHLAMLTATSNGRTQLAVVDLVPLGPPRLVAGFDDADIVRVRWVNNDRLVFEAENLQVPPDQQRVWGLYAVNRDGKGGTRQLIASDRGPNTTDTNIVSRLLPWNWEFHSILTDGSPDIVVSEWLFDGRGDTRAVLLSRLNTVTGERRSLSTGVPDRPRGWLLDGTGLPRALTSTEDGRSTIYWRESGDKPWAKVAEFASFRAEGFRPRFVDAQGQMLVEASVGRDHAALFRFDPVAGKLEPEPLISLKGFDLQPSLEVEWGSESRLLGVHFATEQEGSYWFDKDLRQVQQSIDAAMPKDRINRLRCGRCSGARFFVVESSSDRHPGEYYLFDRQALKLQLIGAARPWINEATQGRRSFHWVPARDGLPLPVYLTHPHDAPAGQALPTVVRVHGGPWLRGHTLRWDAEAQFLASRGYRVIEVDFRGSDGYGMKHFAASWKQWGHAMQDDLADATAWAVKQGLADPARICIMGSSYGGYAALMGSVRHPGVYQCAVSFAGVTDIDLMYRLDRSDLSGDWKRYGMPTLIGDPVADAELLKAASPLLQAHRIKVPVLLAHGRLDRRVPIEHSQKFRKVAEGAGVKVEWVVYPEEPHGFRQAANEADFWTRTEAFLARSLGTSRPAEGAAAR